MMASGHRDLCGPAAANRREPDSKAHKRSEPRAKAAHWAKLQARVSKVFLKEPEPKSLVNFQVVAGTWKRP